jgi:DNA (cytosine-5)-methyltransferase 1
MTLTVGSLFSGIGGIDLGLERAGMNVIWQSEIDPFACKVLKKHWPEVPNHGDIKEIKWHEIERPDVICGGYPCQPFSTAGKRRGTNDPRHLWPWVREAISELRPKYAILENVRGHLSMGGAQVVGDLAQIGYDAEWRIISAASLGANHRRDRIIIVAYPNNAGERTPRRNLDDQTSKSSAERRDPRHEFGGRSSEVADTNGRRQQKCDAQERGLPIFNACSTQPKFSQWEIEPDVGRVAHGIPHRVDRLKGLGNAVVPQLAETVGRLVMKAAGQ